MNWVLQEVILASGEERRMTDTRRAEQKQSGDGGRSEEWCENEQEPKAWWSTKEASLTEPVLPGRGGLLS